jgi:hypothetical protein
LIIYNCNGWGRVGEKRRIRVYEASWIAWACLEAIQKKKLELINIGIKQDNKELKFGMLIIAYVRSGLVALLQNYINVFAWLYANMYGLDTKIMVRVCVCVCVCWRDGSLMIMILCV